MKRSRTVVHNATKPPLEIKIAHLRDLDLKGLRARWQSIYRRQAPSHLPRHLLFAVLAYQLQAEELGDLVPDTIRMLKQIGSGSTIETAVRLTAEFDRRRSNLKPGTILLRRPVKRCAAGPSRHSFGDHVRRTERDAEGHHDTGM